MESIFLFVFFIRATARRVATSQGGSEVGDRPPPLGLIKKKSTETLLNIYFLQLTFIIILIIMLISLCVIASKKIKSIEKLSTQCQSSP